ncbi:MAG: hypothetical protein C0598_01075, partial [Marinilabiliales bacterium]
SYVESGNTVPGTTTGETFAKGGFAIPFGLGLNYRFSENWAANVVADYRTIFNDDVDVWRGGSKNDNVFYLGFGVSYYIKPGFVKRKTRSRKSKQINAAVIETKKPKKESTKHKSENNVGSSENSKNTVGDIPIYDMDYRTSNRAKENNTDKNYSKSDVQLMIPPKSNDSKGIIFRVQILAKSTRLTNIQYLRNKYNLNGDIYEVYQDGIYRYSSGEFLNYSNAYSYSQMLKNKGVRDAFVVVYKDGKRIKLTEDLKN